MNSLYLLSFVLTADREKAEQCFVSSLEDSVKSNRIFKEWARSWARRAVIQNAIGMIQPAPHAARNTPRPAIDTVAATSQSDASLTAVLQLGPFERFVFVMSVLEHYSDQDCSVLLGCPRRAVALAKVHAAENIAMFAGSGMSSTGRSRAVFEPTRWLAQGA